MPSSEAWNFFNTTFYSNYTLILWISEFSKIDHGRRLGGRNIDFVHPLDEIWQFRLIGRRNILSSVVQTKYTEIHRAHDKSSNEWTKTIFRRTDRQN